MKVENVFTVTGVEACVSESDTVNDWALNVKALMEKHMKVENVFTVTGVEACVSESDCRKLLTEEDFEGQRRRAETPKTLVVEVKARSAPFATAGTLVNELRHEVAQRKFRVPEARITKITTPDCEVEGSSSTKLNKLASSSLALSALLSYAV